MAALEMFRGDYQPFRGVAIQVDDSNPFNLTNCKLFFTAKNSILDPDVSAVIALDSYSVGGISVDGPAVDGAFIVEIQPTHTENIVLQGASKVLVYDVQLETSDLRVYTVDIGTLTIKEDVTRRRA